MSLLKSLSFTIAPHQIAQNPKLVRRQRLIDRLEEQRKLVADPSFTVTERRWIKDAEGVKRFTQALQVFTLAESLGGVESLINHPWSMTHAAIPEALRLEKGIGPDLLRLSVFLSATRKVHHVSK